MKNGITLKKLSPPWRARMEKPYPVSHMPERHVRYRGGDSRCQFVCFVQFPWLR